MQTTETKSLYQIDSEFMDLFDELNDLNVAQSTGQEIDQERLLALLEALDITEDELKHKAGNYAKYDRHLETLNNATDARIMSLANEIKRLEKIKAGRNKTRTDMNERLLSVMSKRSIKKLELGDDQGYFLQTESKSLDASGLTDEQLVALYAVSPDLVTRKESKVTYQPNKTAIKKLVDKDPDAVPGCRIVVKKKLTLK